MIKIKNESMYVKEKCVTLVSTTIRNKHGNILKGCFEYVENDKKSIKERLKYTHHTVMRWIGAE